MAANGKAGIELDLDHVPQRETNMSAYEILSKYQERMLMVLKQGRKRRPTQSSRSGSWISPPSSGQTDTSRWW